MYLRRPTPLALGIVLASLAGLAQAEDITSNLRINGFATAGASWLSEDFRSKYQADARYPSSGIDETASLNHDTVLGLQLTYELNDRFDIVGQLVSTGRANYDTRLEWAYIAYQLNENLRLRAGRFAAPMFMYSESLHVGQSYPWVRLPAELYATTASFSSVDGLDLLYSQPMGDWKLDAQLTLGGSKVDKLNVKVEGWSSLNLALSNGPFTVRGGYSASKVDFDFSKNPYGIAPEQLVYLFDQYGGVDLNMQKADATFADIGISFDDGNWFAAAEFGREEVEGYINDFEAGFVTVGHYFGKWLPYAMFSKINSINSDECLTQMGPAAGNAATTAAQLSASIPALQASAATAASTAAQATATAANQFANGDFAGYAVSIQTAATQSALASSLQSQVVLAGAQAMAITNTIIPNLIGATAVTCAGVEQTSYTAGFRYDATKNVSVKFAVDHVRDFNGTIGLFAAPPPADESTEVFTLNVNAAF
jgi:hypothetical protein